MNICREKWLIIIEMEDMESSTFLQRFKIFSCSENNQKTICSRSKDNKNTIWIFWVKEYQENYQSNLFQTKIFGFLLFALVARTIKYLFLNLSISNIYDSAFLLPSGPSVSSVCPFNLWPIAKRVQILYPEFLVLK